MEDLSHLDGQVETITGGSAGIGKASAEALAAAGANVVLAARRKSQLESVGGRSGMVVAPLRSSQRM